MLPALLMTRQRVSAESSSAGAVGGHVVGLERLSASQTCGPKGLPHLGLNRAASSPLPWHRKRKQQQHEEDDDNSGGNEGPSTSAAAAPSDEAPRHDKRQKGKDGKQGGKLERPMTSLERLAAKVAAEKEAQQKERKKVMGGLHS